MSDDPFKKDVPATEDTLVDSLRPGLNDILGIRDAIGAKKRDVFLLTRTWSGTNIGEGNFKDETTKVFPTPHLVDYSHSIMLHDGGAVRSGDIIIKSLSKLSYPQAKDIDCRVDQDLTNVQKFYFINNMEYTVIHVKDKYLTWDVQVRKISDETNKVQP